MLFPRPLYKYFRDSRGFLKGLPFSLALAAIPAGVFSRVTVVSQYPALLQEAEQAGFHAIRNDRPDDGISRTICDYIAGMTDKYAIYKYSEIFIPTAWQVR